MCPPQVLGYQLTLFGPRGADYARYITTGPPSFWTMRRLCEAYCLLVIGANDKCHFKETDVSQLNTVLTAKKWVTQIQELAILKPFNLNRHEG